MTNTVPAEADGMILSHSPAALMRIIDTRKMRS
jgi:hypothetical protein